MQLLIRASVALAVLVPFLGSATAQQQPPKDSRSIQLNVILSGPGSSGLTPQDFHLLDNKESATIQSVRQLSPTAEAPHVIIVIDAVNTIFSRVAYVRSQVQEYLKSNGGHLANPTTFVVLTDTSTEVQKGFSTNGNELSAVLAQAPIGLREIRRDSGIWGANERTNLSLKALSEVTAYAGTIPGRKIVLWISPGWPLLSGPRIDLDNKQQKEIFASVVDYSRAMRLADVTLYNLDPIGPEEGLLRASYYKSFVKGIRKPSETDLGDLSLQVLAEQSGGQTITGNSDIAGSIGRSLAETAAWYKLTFEAHPAEHADEYHHVQVQVAKPGVAVRTRDGYYAQP
jgi:VWFA-related protein